MSGLGEHGLGGLFLVGYVATIGVGTYVMKVALEDLSAYQVNLLMAVAMLVACVPAVLIADHTLAIERRHLGVVVLSAVFLHERFDWVSAMGLVLTLGGVALLSFRT